ncbi:hypothetical protein BCON_0125g00170 [Botryotinia convoluta]|uniref:Uncharacterized protein n=1 Tax=Botryotinia convoluta TaxID=54673 RepID=A0A4Z1HWD8_9HELO|nr:hypothetical protein BCON_0125g00170 [Botryotinia convoluta]
MASPTLRSGKVYFLILAPLHDMAKPSEINHYPFLELHANVAIDAVGEKREETSIDADAAYGLYED